MTILILVTLFPSYVKADVQLSQEFVEPIKNWSFEGRDTSIPGDGVYGCPPWETNNGGWRNVRGDLDGDGDCDCVDARLFSKAYTGDYDWHADFDGDGDVDYEDTRIFSNSYMYDIPRHLDGIYSWYTGGGGDYQMWQTLDSDTINAIKGEKVAFAFWFLPEFVASDGSQNYARAEIRYWYIYDDPYHGPRTAVVQKNGDWVYPKETKWHDASVLTWVLPSTTYYVKVVIHGPDFKAWIDQTSLSISETKYVQDEDIPDLKMSMALNLFQLSNRTVPTDFRDCEAFFGFSITADSGTTSSGDYPSRAIKYVELRIKLITTGYVSIRNVTQSNSDDYKTDPEQTAKIENNQITSARVATGVITAMAMFTISPVIGLPDIGNLFFSVVTGQGVSYLMSTWKSDASEPVADNPGESAIARCLMGENRPYWVTFANERCLFKVEFYKGQSVTIEATAKALFILQSPVGAAEIALQESISTTVSL